MGHKLYEHDKLKSSVRVLAQKQTVRSIKFTAWVQVIITNRVYELTKQKTY